MLRVSVAVVLAVALLGVAQPAVEDARSIAAERAVERELAEIERAITELRTEAAVPYGQPGARRVVTLDLPERAFASAGIEYVAIGGVPDGDRTDSDTDLLVSKVADRTPSIVRIDADLRVERSRGEVSWLTDDSLVLRTGGRHRITLEPVRHDGQRVIVVRELG